MAVSKNRTLRIDDDTWAKWGAYAHSHGMPLAKAVTLAMDALIGDQGEIELARRNREQDKAREREVLVSAVRGLCVHGRPFDLCLSPQCKESRSRGKG